MVGVVSPVLQEKVPPAGLTIGLNVTDDPLQMISSDTICIKQAFAMFDHIINAPKIIYRIEVGKDMAQCFCRK